MTTSSRLIMNHTTWPCHLHGDDGAVPFSLADCSHPSPLPFLASWKLQVCSYRQHHDISKSDPTTEDFSCLLINVKLHFGDALTLNIKNKLIMSGCKSNLWVHVQSHVAKVRKTGLNINIWLIFCIIQMWPGSVAGEGDLFGCCCCCCWWMKTVSGLTTGEQLAWGGPPHSGSF